MKITNKFGLPEALVLAVKNDDYNRGASDITVTQLIAPPRIRCLKMRHGSEVVEDVADRIWSLVGQIGHGILERASGGIDMKKLYAAVVILANDVADIVNKANERGGPVDVVTSEVTTAVFRGVQKILEEMPGGKFWRASISELREDRLYTEVLGLILGGQFDNLHLFNGKLTDYKFTSYYAVRDGLKPEWNNQLNTLAEICIRNGHAVDSVQVVAILKDHSSATARRNSKYPQVPVVAVQGELWSAAERIEYIETRMRLHIKAELFDDDSRLPECTDDERWKKQGQSALMKGKNKRAVKLFDSRAEAEAYIIDKSLDSVHFIVDRPSEYPRCERYCSVNRWCSQWDVEGCKNAE